MSARSPSPITTPGYRAGLPARNLHQTFKVEILTPDEARALIHACSSRAPTGIRNRALLVLLYRGGLRVAEALALKPADVDTRLNTVRVLRGKGDKLRVASLDPEAMAVVERWQDRRKALGLRSHFLICTLAGGRVQPSYVRTLLPRLARKVGITKRVHPHALRHTFAAELSAEGAPVKIISDLLGHSNLSVTDRYLKHIHPADAVAVIQSRKWSL